MENGYYKAKLIKSGNDWLLWARFGNEQKPAVVASFELDNGHVMEWTGWLSPAAYDRTVEALNTLGFSGKDLDMFNGQEPHGRCTAVVKTEDYKDKSTQKIAFINSATRFIKEEDRLSVAELKKLSAQMKRSSSFDPDEPGSKLAF